MMTDQYLRTLKLLVGGSRAPGVSANPNAAIDLSELRVQFEVRNATTQSLKSANIRIYNPSQDTSFKIQNEFSRVELSAGYGDDTAPIFQGEIAAVKRGKLNAAETFVDITAQDGDAAYNWATTNRTLPRGWTADQLYAALLQDLQPYGITAGYKPPFTPAAAPRGRACFGMTRDLLRDLAEQQGCEWGIEDGRLNFIPKASFVPGEMVVLTPGTGLIGTPTQTIDGIEAVSLLNHRIRAGSQVKIDASTLATMSIVNQVAGQTPQIVAGLDPSGTYTALCVQHQGDTRGQDWYTRMICIAVDPTAAFPLVGPARIAVPEVGMP